MLQNMNRLSQYPDHSLVYCAHEYTESNYKFLNFIDPSLCGNRYNDIKAMRMNNEPTVPSTIGQEKETNLFMKCNEARVQKLLHCTDAEDTMTTLRRMKNEFK